MMNQHEWDNVVFWTALACSVLLIVAGTALLGLSLTH